MWRSSRCCTSGWATLTRGSTSIFYSAMLGESHLTTCRHSSGLGQEWKCQRSLKQPQRSLRRVVSHTFDDQWTSIFSQLADQTSSKSSVSRLGGSFRGDGFSPETIDMTCPSTWNSSEFPPKNRRSRRDRATALRLAGRRPRLGVR